MSSLDYRSGELGQNSPWWGKPPCGDLDGGDRHSARGSSSARVWEVATFRGCVLRTIRLSLARNCHSDDSTTDRRANGAKIKEVIFIYAEGADMSTVTHERWLAEGTARFGPDMRDWKFVCPSCGDVAGARDFAVALAANPRERGGRRIRASEIVARECIGRSVGAPLNCESRYRRRGCARTADDILPAPVAIVTRRDGEETMLCAFEFAAHGMQLLSE